MDETTAQQRITWEEKTFAQFQEILKQIPGLIRGIAETRVTKKAEAILKEQSRWVIEEKDMVDAFFAETPPDFRHPMKASMEQLGIDYKKYGHE